MSYVLSLRVFLPRATPLPSLSAAATAPRRMCDTAVGRGRFAFLSFAAAAAAAVAGDDGRRRLSAELWVGTSMYISMYTATHSGSRGGVCGAALTAAPRRAASTYLVVVDI